MLGILNGIQGLVNLLFFLVIAGTLGVSWFIRTSVAKNSYGAEFPWGKTAGIVGDRSPALDRI